MMQICSFSISFLLDLHLIYLHLYLLQQVAYSKVFDTVSDVPVNEHQLCNHWLLCVLCNPAGDTVTVLYNYIVSSSQSLCD